jgi:hypothetical protein
MKTREQPGLVTARGSAVVLHEDAPQPSYDASYPHAELVKRYGKQTLLRYRYIAQVVRGVDLSELGSVKVASWDELAIAADETATKQIDAQKLVVPPLTSFDNQDLAERSLATDSRAAAAQITAFLEVIPRVVYDREFANPRDQLRRYAEGSIPTMVRWSRLDDRNEARLTYGVSYPKPDLTGSDKLTTHDGLRFHTKWFEAADSQITLKTSKLSHIRGYPDPERKSQRSEEKLELSVETTSPTIMGCPAASLVPRLYGAMLDVAHRSDLFVDTYLAERQNHGYIDEQII